MNTITTAASAFSLLTTAINALSVLGWKAAVTFSMDTPVTTTERVTVSHSASAVPPTAASVFPEYNTPAPAAAPVPAISSNEARIAAVVGTTVYATHTRRTSSGLKICGADDAGVALYIAPRSTASPITGWVNVYPESIGKDIHSTKENAERYAGDKVVASLPVTSIAPVVTATFDADTVAKHERFADLVGQTVFANRTRRTSSGFKICEEGNASHTFQLVDEDEVDSDDIIGWVNIYAESIGKDIHSTEDKAAQYASANVYYSMAVVQA